MLLSLSHGNFCCFVILPQVVVVVVVVVVEKKLSPLGSLHRHSPCHNQSEFSPSASFLCLLLFLLLFSLLPAHRHHVLEHIDLVFLQSKSLTPNKQSRDLLELTSEGAGPC